ncbi:hypothetical protein RO3G_00488 [Rhizopus delemar RA 99-880]|uniref:Uncharacterized protein n=1 Tax=Rhizopus delemar (strain RA 99-880 / ATCC MYA-4621 / FGSC 9543 / NRRL 43880) TaxID=246409 RepID=I1BHV4_RHIO9|nr:hypothetical protein RO3G_00488 [Rhizopus delemar RA 99-880]|eukprot:EIE75784.1 hypothetical protein RO3G_00488 [Rhizopus delemar RA 99-880]
MYSLVHCKAQATQPAPDTDKIDIPDEAPTSSHNQQDYIQPLCQTVERLTSELLQARLEIKILQARLDHLPPTPPDHLSSQNFPTLQESQTRSTAFLDAPWNNPAKLQAIKQPSLQQREQRRQQREAAAARFFNLPRQIKVLHTCTSPRRPTSLLELCELRSENLDGDILADPKYSHLTPSERDIIASEIQQTRLERALQHIRPPVKFAVARLFLEKQWISKSAFDALSTERTQPQIASIFKQNTAPATQATFFTNTDTDNDSIMRYQRDDPIQNLSSSGATTSPRL